MKYEHIIVILINGEKSKPMICPKCGKENAEDSRFRSACGSDLRPEKAARFSETKTMQTRAIRLARGTVLTGKPTNLLGWIAREKEKDATDAFRKNDFSGARILYEILELESTQVSQ